MKLLLLYWAFLIAGFILGDRIRKREGSLRGLPSLMMITIDCLCFVMGLRMGVNEQVTSNLGVIGLQAFIITFCCVAGSMLAIFGSRKLLGMDRCGNVPDKDSAITVAQVISGSKENTEEDSSFDFRSSAILLGVVAAGMIIGAFALAPKGAGFLGWFDLASNRTMVALLCGLMFLVGLDMGHSGMVIENLKRAGWRILIFPIAVAIGTMVFGTAACLLMGMGLRESVAIPLGYGWYSYAPIVIAGAGQQYMVASAVSFMHNVIREVAGIILIPLAAKKIGYLESTGIPGIAAMDICLPIVERSCRTDTVIYSFTIGFFLCIIASIGVPLVMGV